MWRPLLLVLIILCANGFGGPLSAEENKIVQETCGKLNNTRERRSTNGIRTDEIFAPWVAAVGIGPHDIYCTAVWISDRHLITAAHCLNFIYYSNGVAFSPYAVNTRNVFPTFSNDWKQYEVIEAFQIEKVHYPWLYLPVNPSTFGDIALAEVAQADPKPISRPACLPKNDINFGRNITMYGYGVDVSDNSTKGLGVLRSIRSNTVLCPLHGIYSICFNGFPQLACHGDSGGPLMTESPDRRQVINGIMATINHLCRKETWNDVVGYMNTATNVFHHLDWICQVSGVCPTEDLKNYVKTFDAVVRAKYRTFNATELPRYNV